jgi:hypothetical protein
MSIQPFIDRCTAFCESREVSQVWLSKKLFGDTYRIKNLAEGTSDVGVMRLQRADVELTELEAQMPPVAQGGDPPAAEAAA